MLVWSNFVSTAQRGRANPVEACSDLWHQYWVAAEFHSAAILVMKVKKPRLRMVPVVRAPAPSGCVRAASLPTDWQLKEPRRTNIPN